MLVAVFKLVLANGGIVGSCGFNVIASAARYHAVPVIVCAPTHSISQSYPFDTDVFDLCGSPDAIYNFEDAHDMKNVEITNHYFDYVAPEFLSLFITNMFSCLILEEPIHHPIFKD
jgi:translation initiation factor eIF-2B subunit beta